MMHHQLLQHFSLQETLVPGASIAKGDSISRLFMEHGIHVVLTGHMHTSNITTYFNETLTDSIIEITTGSPIAYPSPYRWLTINTDRTQMTVNTRSIKTTSEITDFQTYGRDELIRHMPQMLRSITYTLLNEIDKIRNSGDNSDSRLLNDLFSWLPADRTVTADMAWQYLGNPFTLTQLTTNEGNEFLKQTDTIVSMTQTGLEQMLDKMMEEHFGPIERKLRIRLICGLAKVPQNLLFAGLLEDKTYAATRFANVTNDLYTRIQLSAPKDDEASIALPESTPDNTDYWYDLLGRRLPGKPRQSGIYLYGNKKVYIP